MPSTVPPGSWTGATPELFRDAKGDDGWGGAHHTRADAFEGALAERCYICATIYRDLTLKARETAESFQTFYRIQQTSDNHYVLDFTTEITYGPGASPSREAVESIGKFIIFPKTEMALPERPHALTNNTSSRECEQQVQRWLGACREHADCRRDCRTRQNYQIRLLHINWTRQQLRLQTFEPGTPFPKYATLSHCWAPDSMMRLKNDTQRELTDGRDLRGLPSKFQDAVKIAQWMGVNYLWIDALCIFQDSVEDWHAQSNVMGDIYTGSYCNIAAMSERDQGFLSYRPKSLVEPCEIRNPGSRDVDKTHIIGYDDFWCNSLLDGRLHTRAWVLQERLLSPRTIHFGKEQIFWECRTMVACEAYPEGIPEPLCNRRTLSWRQLDEMLLSHRSERHHGALWRFLSWISSLIWAKRTKPNPRKLHQVYGTWSAAVEHYMSGNLTRPEDKLVAISGIAQKVQAITGEPYLAGHWANELLPQSLLWYVPNRRMADDRPSLRPGANGGTYRAPSWSWASLDAKLAWNWPAECDQVLIDILDTRVEAHPGSKLGAVRAAEMRIQGRLFRATLKVLSDTPHGQPETDGCYGLQVERNRRGRKGFDPWGSDILHLEPVIYLDTPATSLDRSLLSGDVDVPVFLLPVCTGWRGRSGQAPLSLAGLLLRQAAPTTQQEVRYERVGIFGLNSWETEELHDAYDNDAYDRARVDFAHIQFRGVNDEVMTVV